MNESWQDAWAKSDEPTPTWIRNTPVHFRTRDALEGFLRSATAKVRTSLPDEEVEIRSAWIDVPAEGVDELLSAAPRARTLVTAMTRDQSVQVAFRQDQVVLTIQEHLAAAPLSWDAVEQLSAQLRLAVEDHAVAIPSGRQRREEVPLVTALSMTEEDRRTWERDIHRRSAVWAAGISAAVSAAVSGLIAVLIR